MGLRRTYFGWDKRTTSMVNTARADLAAGRLPWVSTKTPAWAAVASGQHDAEIDSMLRALDALGGPVWLTLHHEPEDDVERGDAHAAGGIEAWKGMQRRVRARMDALGIRNVAFAPVLMAWTFDTRSGRNPSAWWADGIWDFAGLDHYIEKLTHTTLEVPAWNNARAFYAARGLKVAVGEWGNRGTDASAASEMQGFYDTAVRSSGPGQIIGLAYFDSGLNTTYGSWELTGEPLEKFRELMRARTSLRAVQTAA
jgi:hypothetical protein